MSHLADVQAYLIAEAPSIFTSSNTFTGRMPASPEAAIVLSGFDAGRPEYNTDGGAVAHHGVQIRVRHQDEDTAWAWMAAAEAALRKVRNSTLSGTRYLCIRPTGAASPAGWTNTSLVLVQNYDAMRSE